MDERLVNFTVIFPVMLRYKEKKTSSLRCNKFSDLFKTVMLDLVSSKLTLLTHFVIQACFIIKCVK